MVYDCSFSKNIYLNVVVNIFKKFRGLVFSVMFSFSKISGCRVVFYEVVLGGRLVIKISFLFSCLSSFWVEDLKGVVLYSCFKEYLFI